MEKEAPLPAEWFRRPALDVAGDLLGCRLCRRTRDGIQRWPITETEAYEGPEDKASHARSGRTNRTAVMFGPGGIWYIYLCYGVHWLLNIVTCAKDEPGAVLLRGAGEINGPGRLTKALAIDGALNRLPANRQSGLWIEPGKAPEEGEITRTPRIGVAYAGPDWGNRPYRFIRKDRLQAAAKARIVQACQSQ